MSDVTEALLQAQPPAVAQRPGCLELLGRHGQLKRRLPLPDGEGVLGRDLACDIILDDPYVCPRHLRLQEQDGRLRLDDLGSVNGMARGPGRPRVSELVLASGECVRIGRSLLRYRSASAPLPPTLPDRPDGTLLRPFERPWLLALLIAATPLASLLKVYLATVSRTPLSKLLLEPVITLLLLLCWAALWAFVGRLLVYRWHIFGHLALASAAVLAFLLVDTGTGYLSFALDLRTVHDILDHVAQVMILALLFYGHLRLVSAAPLWPLARAAAISALLLFGLTALADLSDHDEFSASPPFEETFKAPIFRLAPSSSLDDFFAEAGRLPAELDERAAKKR